MSSYSPRRRPMPWQGGLLPARIEFDVDAPTAHCTYCAMSGKSSHSSTSRAARTKKVHAKAPKSPVHKMGLPVKDEPSEATLQETSNAGSSPTSTLPMFLAIEAQAIVEKDGTWETIPLPTQVKMTEYIISSIRLACRDRTCRLPMFFCTLAEKGGVQLPDEPKTFPSFLRDWAVSCGYSFGFSLPDVNHRSFFISW